jgi:hypothetical protein
MVGVPVNQANVPKKNINKSETDVIPKPAL